MKTPNAIAIISSRPMVLRLSPLWKLDADLTASGRLLVSVQHRCLGLLRSGEPWPWTGLGPADGEIAPDLNCGGPCSGRLSDR